MSKKGERRQTLAALCCNLLTISYGACCAWTSVSFIELQENKSLLPSGPLTENEASLMVAILNAGGLAGNILFVYIAEKFGRRNPLFYLAIPQLASWLLIIFAQDVYYILASRILTGFVCGGISVCTPVFIAEISNDKNRGTLNTFFILAMNFGILLGFSIANFVEYKLRAILLSLIPIIFFNLFYFVPESPTFLLKSSNKELAEKSMKYYGKLEEHPEADKFIIEKVDETRKEADSSLTLKDFLQPAAKKAFFIAISLIMFNQLSGVWVLLSYTSSVFEDAGSSLSVIESSIVISFVQICANILTTYFIDKIGRKIIFTISAIGTGLGMTAMGLYTLHQKELDDHYKWIPLATFSFIMFIAQLGLMPIPFIIAIDIIPRKILNVTMSFILSLLWIFGFIAAILYPLLNRHIGMHGSFFVFASFCFVGALFAVLVVPETKGKSHDAIMRLLVNRKVNNNK